MTTEISVMYGSEKVKFVDIWKSQLPICFVSRDSYFPGHLVIVSLLGDRVNHNSETCIFLM